MPPANNSYKLFYKEIVKGEICLSSISSRLVGDMKKLVFIVAFLTLGTLFADTQTIGKTQHELTQFKNGIFFSPSMFPWLISPSLGYLRSVTDKVFFLSYINYSFNSFSDLLQSSTGQSLLNIDSENTAWLFAIGPQVYFYKPDWGNGRVTLFCGLLVGYYSHTVRLLPGGRNLPQKPEPPHSVQGSDSWQGLAGGANIGLHISLPSAEPPHIFLFLSFGFMLANRHKIGFTYVLKDGQNGQAMYVNEIGKYSFTGQLLVGIGNAF